MSACRGSCRRDRAAPPYGVSPVDRSRIACRGGRGDRLVRQSQRWCAGRGCVENPSSLARRTNTSFLTALMPVDFPVTGDLRFRRVLIGNHSIRWLCSRDHAEKDATGDDIRCPARGRWASDPLPVRAACARAPGAVHRGAGLGTPRLLGHPGRSHSRIPAGGHGRGSDGRVGNGHGKRPAPREALVVSRARRPAMTKTEQRLARRRARRRRSRWKTAGVTVGLARPARAAMAAMSARLPSGKLPFAPWRWIGSREWGRMPVAAEGMSP